MRRVIFDTNLYINILLSPDPGGSAISALFDLAVAGTYELVLPVDVITELGIVVARRAYLRSRISQADVDRLRLAVAQFAVLVPALTEEPPRVSRDRKDDYLLALAVRHDADVIVTRDHDLLTLGRVLEIEIIDPVEALRRVRSET